MLSNKYVNSEKITLANNEKIITNDKEIAKVLNDFLSNIIKNLNIPQKNHTNLIIEIITDSTLKATLKYCKHSSVLEIKRQTKSDTVFTFNHITKEDVIKEIKNLGASKVSQEDDIPTKIIEKNSNIFSIFICQSFNNMIDVCIFPISLRLTNITPVYKKGSKHSKKKYRPVSISLNISEIYERCPFKQISNYFQNIFSKFQCSFRQGLSAQYCPISMIEKWKKSLDKGNTFAALLTDLTDGLQHDLIIAKLNSYGYSLSDARLMQSYVSNRKQRTKIYTTYSSWEEILFGVPHSSILDLYQGTSIF